MPSCSPARSGLPLSSTASGTSSAMSHAPIPRPGDPPDRVAEILDAAADAFTQQTYDATTLDQIGDALGVTKGSIYHHYRSKAHLFTAVYQRALEMNIATVEPIARQPGVRAIDRLYRMAYAHAMQVMKHLSYQRVAVQGLDSHLMGRINEEQRARLDEVISLRDHYEELFVNVLTQAIEAGELPRQHPRLAAKPLFGAINWTTMWYQPRPGETAADRERLATHLALRLVRPDPGLPARGRRARGRPADAAHRLWIRTTAMQTLPIHAAPGSDAARWSAVAEWYHAYFTGLVMTLVTRRGSREAADLVFHIFRRQHLERFLPGLEKLGIAGLPPAVAAARYHYLSNAIGGVRVEYMEESSRKVWVRYPTPRWAYSSIGAVRDPRRGVPGVVARAGTGTTASRWARAGSASYAPSRQWTASPAWKATTASTTGISILCARRPRCATLPTAAWPQDRLQKARRNYAMEYVRTACPSWDRPARPARSRLGSAASPPA